MAACILLAAATAGTREKAERVETIANQALDGADASLAFLVVYRAALNAIAYLGQHFTGATTVAMDTLRRFLCDPSPLLQAFLAAPDKVRDHQAACDLLCADATKGLCTLVRLATAKQRNSGIAFVTSVGQPRPLTAAEANEPAAVARHKLLFLNSVQLIVAVTEAVAVDEPECATQAANMLYQRLHSGFSSYDNDTLMGLMAVGAAGPSHCFDAVVEMLLTLAVGILPPSMSAGATTSPYNLGPSTLTFAFQRLFSKVRSPCLKVSRKETLTIDKGSQV